MDTLADRSFLRWCQLIKDTSQETQEVGLSNGRLKDDITLPRSQEPGTYFGKRESILVSNVCKQEQLAIAHRWSPLVLSLLTVHVPFQLVWLRISTSINMPLLKGLNGVKTPLSIPLIGGYLLVHCSTLCLI